MSVQMLPAEAARLAFGVYSLNSGDMLEQDIFLGDSLISGSSNGGGVIQKKLKARVGG